MEAYPEGQGLAGDMLQEGGYYDEGPAGDDWNRHERDSQRRSRSRSRSPRSRSPRHRSPRDDRGRRSSERDGRRPRDSRGHGPSDRRGRNFASRDCRVYVTNIPYELKWQELKDIMRKVGDVQYVEMISDNRGQPRGTAVVEFTRADDASTAVKELDDYEVLGRKLKVREDRVDDDKYERQLRQHKENEQVRKQQSSMSNLIGGGANASFLNSKNSDPINSTVFVSNLDYKVTWQKIKDVFRRAGNVLRVDIAEDNEKKSKGFGVVVFETPAEALQAISMFNGYTFGDRAIVARLDRDSALSKVLGTSGGNTQGALGLGVGGQSGGNQQQTNALALLQLQSLAALSALASGALGNLGGSGSGGSGFSGGAAGLGNQGLEALSSTGLGALQGLGGLSSLLGNIGASMGGASLGHGSAYGGGSLSGSSSFGGFGNSGANDEKISSGSRRDDSGRDDSGRQIFVRNVSI